MSFFPLLAGTILYVAVAIGSLCEGEKWTAIVFTGYAFANLGFLVPAWLRFVGRG